MGKALAIIPGVLWLLLVVPFAFSETLSLPGLVRKTMAAYYNQPEFSPMDLAQKLPEGHAFQKPAGVFVTLSRDGKPRACWGNVYPQYKDIAEATIYATLGALTKEYRYPPIRQAEWAALKPQVTVIKALIPIESLKGQNPLRDGLMVRSGSQSGVMLPGETVDAHYQLVQSKLKAGIQPGQPFQMYRIIADVYQ